MDQYIFGRERIVAVAPMPLGQGKNSQQHFLRDRVHTIPGRVRKLCAGDLTSRDLFKNLETKIELRHEVFDDADAEQAEFLPILQFTNVLNEVVRSESAKCTGQYSPKRGDHRLHPLTICF